MLVDAHVHMYNHFNVADFLDAASDNFHLWLASTDLPSTTSGMLLIADGPDYDAFARFTDGNIRGWQIEKLDEPMTVAATRRDRGQTVFVVGGRQIRSREGVEILAHGTRTPYEDGLPIRVVLDKVRDSGSVNIVPWGFGKWWLRRKTVVRELLREYAGGEFYVGDHGGRLRGTRRPTLLDLANELGWLTLSGSGPMPLASEIKRPGSLGFIARPELDWNRPFSSLKFWLRGLKTSPEEYGKLTPFPTFLRRQTTQQVRKRVFLIRRWAQTVRQERSA